MIRCFSNYIAIHIIPNILKEEDIDLVIEEINNNKYFEKPDTEIETYKSVCDLVFECFFLYLNLVVLSEISQKKSLIYLKKITIVFLVFTINNPFKI